MKQPPVARSVSAHHDPPLSENPGSGASMNAKLVQRLGFFVLVILVVTGVVVSRMSPSPAGLGVTNPNELPPPSNDQLRLVFTYGSEKESWLKEATAAFNRQGLKQDGKTIVVEAIPMGSGECIDELLDGRRQAHLVSPASAAFIRIGNAKARAANGRDLIPTSDNLVLSPVVIAMWKPMAEALGWGSKPVGWSDILALASEQRGWAAHGHAEWGPFTFGHTHPEYSNSGLISVFAEVYAGAGKVAGLSSNDLAEPKVGAFVHDIERAVVHYGSSTGFFAKKLSAGGPSYLSAAVLYENNVIEDHLARASKPSPFPPLVAIYPKEGTFWSDHPAGIVDRDWVTPTHRAAAKAYLEFLLARPQQEAALRFGFRPAAVDIPLGAPLDVAHGIDPQEPKTTLEVPTVEVMDGIIRLWRANKKRSNVVLVVDVSGSMNDEEKIIHAREGAAKLVGMLGDEDQYALLTFNNQSTWAQRPTPLNSTSRPPAIAQVQGLFAGGGTALYDAVGEACTALMAKPDPERISAVVVLSDGADTDSKMSLAQLLAQIRGTSERPAPRVFTIGYGQGAKGDVLKTIAEATQGKYYAGTQRDIVAVFKDISTFF
jgi:Ca-activated chloride channel homolog